MLCLSQLTPLHFGVIGYTAREDYINCSHPDAQKRWEENGIRTHRRIVCPERNNALQSRGMGSARLYREGAMGRNTLALFFFLPPISPRLLLTKLGSKPEILRALQMSLPPEAGSSMWARGKAESRCAGAKGRYLHNVLNLWNDM